MFFFYQEHHKRCFKAVPPLQHSHASWRGSNKQQAAMARTLGRTAVTVVHEKGGVLPPFTLPPILDASDALASCCLALVKPKHWTTE